MDSTRVCLLRTLELNFKGVSAPKRESNVKHYSTFQMQSTPRLSDIFAIGIYPIADSVFRDCLHADNLTAELFRERKGKFELRVCTRLDLRY